MSENDKLTPEQEFLIQALNEANEKKSTNAINELGKLLEEQNITLSSKKSKKEKVNNVVEDIDNFDVVGDDVFNPYNEDSEFDIQYGNVQLPSGGLCYDNCGDTIPVAYLTASDEDLITTPSLYSENKMIEVLLSKKILNKNIKVSDLIQADIDYIVLWLRATSYGKDFNISVNDIEKDAKFDTTIDLSKIKFNGLKLKPNKNKNFEFMLPVSKKLIEFRFLTRKDDNDYTKFLELSNERIKKHSLEVIVTKLESIIDNNKNINDDEKLRLINSINVIKEFSNKIDGNSEIITKNVTYRLFKSIVSIDGNTDRTYIKKFVNNMIAMDALSLRKYINNNTPYVDFNVEVKRPESLGGGSFTTFLEIDDTIFLNN